MRRERKMKKFIFFPIIVVSSLFSFCQAEVLYHITDLGTLGGEYSYSYATGVNDSGQVVGSSIITDGSLHGFLHNGTTMIDIGHCGWEGGSPSAINNSGQIVGTIQTYEGRPGAGPPMLVYHAFLYDGDSMIQLGFSFANSINDSGQVVGIAGNGPGFAAVLYDSTTETSLFLGDRSVASGINESGQVVGITRNGYAFLYDGTVTVDLGTLGGSGSRGYDINDTGQVVGYSGITGGSAAHAFLYDGTTMNDLGTLGEDNSNAVAINNSGQIIGASFDDGGTNSVPFYYYKKVINLKSIAC